MKCDQLSIFLENRSGRLAEVTRLLSEAKVNIRALSLADTSDFGILRLIVSDFDKAQTTLKDAGFTVGKTTVVAVIVGDQPGGLHNLLEMLRNASINVEYMYAFVQQSGDHAVIIFRFDRTDQAIELLTEHKIKMIPSDKLSKL
ncbi:ACT domain-containing protein [Desulfovibrio sp. UCD-KL4C]|uniref:ACT domain-containing protein n=1 Tax=Desulfovibrio sp. UCD-KL4C TaxID=2578120 RepID=UPI0025BAAB08|nr:ACT domain-containing protein [Desulfovibrio sp. UCD-KL4C]